jgi:heme A synthase
MITNAHSEAGFTLIEILVLVVGTAVATAVFTILTGLKTPFAMVLVVPVSFTFGLLCLSLLWMVGSRRRSRASRDTHND